jgi:hypothetical protein
MFRRLFAGIVALFAAVALLYALVVRPYYAFWGATEQEINQALPGDRLTPPTAVVSTSALTIHAPVEQVWPWVVQLGQGRGGFYSYDFFENQFAADMHSAGRIVPELQQLKPGDLVSLQANSTLEQGTAMRVALVEPPRALVFAGGWGLYLEPIDAGNTRLLVRYPFDLGTNNEKALFFYGLFEPMHLLMQSGMMMGIKQRAEAGPGGHAYGR